MAQVVVMPQLGNTVESCLITSWLVAVGDEVDASSLLCEIETDKSAMEVPSGVAGTVLELQRPQVVGPWLREVAAFAGLLPRLKMLPVPAHGRTASACAPAFALRRPSMPWVAWLRLSYAHTGHASCEMTPSMCS